ncbi:hypothetical protein [Bradyrhizobium sp. BR 1432]|uniref:hypothetical protein n=1 Tax=Bradyrhizobium sp. BR 1432 TaxID=3447966 RepID=UPI003EE432D5
MTEISPYRSAPVPLTAGARFIRGFKRIGIVAGAIFLLIGIAFSVVTAVEQQDRENRKFAQATCIARLVKENRPLKTRTYDPKKVDWDEFGCPGYYFYGDPVEVALAHARGAPPAPLEYAIQPFSLGLAISIACSAAVFLFFWLIGWLCAGFTRD